ncbi:hypothetical protein CFC21_040251 [Triticum aestivum]|uniref:DUF4220 domain-containing protein n=3 Tax=Triticum TaxID=4564 RepID=A0A9R1FGL4_WHEAT|nr:hypothetical protein CFC21_040251 [Triticum aestivum]CDM81659.1 unnamed protein product [Triticum aestivum]VAH73626.1 unnamed protein product [Triticum turgidum subsp. durum]
MEPATYASFPLAQDQEALWGPPQTVHLGQAPRRGGDWRAWARRAYTVIALLAFTAGFAWAVRRTRRSPCDLAFVITAYYLVAVLCFCVRKLQLQRLDDHPAAAPEQRRSMLAVWAVSVLFLATCFAWAVHRTRRSPRDLALVVTTYWFVAVLCCCVWKLQLLRLDDDPSLAPERRRARLVGWAVSVLFVAACFAWAVYRTHRRPRALAFVIATYYLIAVLYCCLRKLELLRLEDDPAAGPERRRARLAAMAVSVAQGNTVALSAADRMPNLALKLVVFGLTAMAMGLLYFFIFSRIDGEYGRAQSAAAPRAERPLHEQSPEQSA